MYKFDEISLVDNEVYYLLLYLVLYLVDKVFLMIELSFRSITCVKIELGVVSGVKGQALKEPVKPLEVKFSVQI